MSKTMPKLGATVALSLGLVLAGCAGPTANRGVESLRQPVVERHNYTIDLSSGPGGLSIPEQRRLDGWFEAMDLRYGDRIAVDDPLDSPATRAAVQAVAAKHGVLLANEAPVTPGYINAGTTRVIVSRATASVPGCPDWSRKSDTNFANTTSPNYGCSVNGNMAIMVADPEHLIKGATTTGETVVMSSNKAIQTYREKAPTGSNELKATETK